MRYSSPLEIATLAAWLAMVDAWQSRSASVVAIRDAALIWC